MHFQTVFGLDALERISERQYWRWLLYFEVFGPIWWKRNDWNFASVLSSIGGYKTASDALLKFKRVKNNPLENAVILASAFGTLPQEEINELMEAGEIYGS